MKASISIIALLCLVFLAGSACAVSNPSTLAATPTEDSLTTRTGVPAVDSVLTAIESDKPQQLSSLISYTVAPCTTADGLGGPPKCRDGEKEGTLVEVLPFLGGEGSFIRKSEITTWDGIGGHSLYAIYRVSGNALAEEYYPPGDYAIVLVSPDAKTAISLRIGSAGIVRVDELFDTSPETLNQILERDASEVIFAPKIR